jgi:RecB family exonuclease
MNTTTSRPPETMAPYASQLAQLPKRISPSAIARYQACPRAAWFQYVAQVPRIERPSPKLMVGNAVHAALHLFFGLRPEDREPPVEVLHRCLRAVWKRHRRPDTFATEHEEAQFGVQALWLLEQFAERFDTSVVPLARERWVSTRLPNGVELYGKVDRIDGEVRVGAKGALTVIDYKTGRCRLDAEDVAKEYAAQTYLLAVEEEYAREVERVRYLYVAGLDVTWEPEREDVEDVRERLVELTTRMYADREFEAKPGEHCGYCPFAHVCEDAGRVEPADLEVHDDPCF